MTLQRQQYTYAVAKLPLGQTGFIHDLKTQMYHGEKTVTLISQAFLSLTIKLDISMKSYAISMI